MPTRLFSVNLGTGSGGSGGATVSRSGESTIANATQNVTVTFSSAVSSTSYSIDYSLLNTVDAQPIYLQGIVTGKTVNGFTVQLNAPTDSANYIIDYKVSTYV